MDDSFYWFALRSVPLVGNVTYRRLLERFATPERVLKASAAELRRVPGVGEAVVAAITGHDWRPAAERESAAVARSGARIVTCRNEEYPELLREIPDPPPYLYLRGRLPTGRPAVAVVGSRRASDYGLTTTARLVRELAEHGVTVVSGMACGVDAAAHRAALAAGGATVGVLGCGIDVLYPAENRKLYGEMAEQGGLVSEFPMATPPQAEHFPRRNRIISGICRGVLVVEAAEKSGSLITARFALEQGREVFAVPGNISSRASRGTHSLIKQGAKLVESVADILEEIPPRRESGAATAMAGVSLSPGEERLCALLAEGPLHIDPLIVRSGLTVGELSAMLLRLELQGVLMQLPGKMFALS